MRKFTFRFLAALMALVSINANAADFTVGEVNYSTTSDNTCCLVSVTTACPLDLVIPATVSYNGKDYSVTKIGENAFTNCAGMTTCVVPATVNYICYGAFFKPTKIKTLTFLGTTPPDCTASPFATAGYSAYTVVVPAGTWAAYTMAIPRMYNIIEEGYKSVSLTVDGATVKYGIISEKDKLARFESISPKPEGDYTMPDEVELEGATYKVYAIKNSALASSTNLKNIKLSKNLFSINAYGFNKCTNLQSIELPEGLVHMNTSVFNYCESMVSCKMPSTLKRMESNIYAYCYKLKSMDLPKGLEFMGQSQFAHCEALESCTGFENVDSIAGMMFGYCSSLKEIKFPTSPKITSVPSGTFQGCTSLVKVELGNNIKNLEMSAFCMCDSLRSLKIPETVTEIGGSCFMKDSLLVDIKLPAGLTSLGATVFSGCVSLKSMELPVGITRIQTNTFNGCQGLTNVTLKGEVTEIGTTAFSACYNLQFSIPETVKTLGTGAFQNCRSITSAVIPEGVTALPNSVFNGCKKLKDVKIGSKVASIGAYTFKWTAIESVNIPEAVTSIGTQAFMGDSLLKTVTLPAALTSLGTSAFKDCPELPAITLPANLATIGATAFAGCSKLMTVTSLNPVPPTMAASTAFDTDTYAKADLVVPAGAEQAYKDDQYWKLFTKLTSGVEEIAASAWITAGNGYIESSVPVTVYTVSGRQIGTFSGYKSVDPGIYVVRGNNKVTKLFVK